MNSSLCTAERCGFMPDTKQNAGGEENYAQLGK